MKKYHLTLAFALALILIHCNVVFPAAVQKDIVLMIDNSGSMKRNDPNFLTKKALIEFVENLSEDTQVALLIFDHDINLTVPSTLMTQTAKDNILANTDKIDFKGQLTKLPSAVERAIYELKIKGRRESEKSIIFITDGIVDTGDKARDRDKTRWLRENLSEDAARAGIKIFGIALTDQADFELIQSLALKTGGGYFRAFKAEDIPQIFSNINRTIVKIQPEPAI
ncbi:MAG: VWA domain-containing protein, partial [Desulfobacteraceae bacterium]|nr:VWA domain-containing protein [Desulfobacteraceae bacterium]